MRRIEDDEVQHAVDLQENVGLRCCTDGDFRRRHWFMDFIERIDGITFLVAFAPGGVADTVARLVGQGVGAKLGRNVVIENRGGAGGNIAASAVARAAGDGHTLLVTTTALAINETLRKNDAFAATDFKTVAIVASSPESLIAANSNPAGNLAEFMKAAQGKTINFGSAGVGSDSHIAAEYFFKTHGKISATHILFQGGAPAMDATIGGQIDLLATTLGGGAAAQIAGGKVKGLGVAAEKRVPVVPNVPTFAEAGYPGFEASSWVGVFAPAGASPDIVAKLNATVDEGSDGASEADLDRLCPDQRLAGTGGSLLPRRGGEVGQDGHHAGVVDQLSGAG